MLTEEKRKSRMIIQAQYNNAKYTQKRLRSNLDNLEINNLKLSLVVQEAKSEKRAAVRQAKNAKEPTKSTLMRANKTKYNNNQLKDKLAEMSHNSCNTRNEIEKIACAYNQLQTELDNLDEKHRQVLQ